MSAKERNARLDALVEATKSWSTKRQKELQDRVDITKKILQGRTGADRLVKSTTQAGQSVVIKEIDDFLNT
jgi:hypothetical protein